MLGRKAELPDELKGLNLSPAEILAAVNAKGDLEKRVKDQESEMLTLKQNSETNKNAVNTLQTKLAELEANSGRQQQQNDPNQLTSFLDDENKAFAERAAPLAAATFRAAAMAAKMSAKNSLHGKTVQAPSGTIRLTSLWDKWDTEISKAADTIPTVQLQYEATWLNLFNYVKGTHMDDLIGKPGDFIEPVGQSTNVSATHQQVTDDKGTDEEIRQAKKMKMPIERYLEAKKKMRFSAA
jgi:hypothetical protein